MSMAMERTTLVAAVTGFGVVLLLDVLLRRSLLDIGRQALIDATGYEGPAPAPTDLIRIRDVAEVRMGYLEPPFNLMRFNGQPALAISLANVAGGNILTTGANLDALLAELVKELPAGIEVSKFQWQSNLVESSINGTGDVVRITG